MKNYGVTGLPCMSKPFATQRRNFAGKRPNFEGKRPILRRVSGYLTKSADWVTLFSEMTTTTLETGSNGASKLARKRVQPSCRRSKNRPRLCHYGLPEILTARVLVNPEVPDRAGH